MSNRASEPVLVKNQVERYTPKAPAPIKLSDEKFIVCPNEDPDVFVCMSVADAKKVIRNKTTIAKWMKQAKAVISFYERQNSHDPGPDPVN